MNLPGFTKQAIRKSFMKLLDERPVNQITIKDIVEDCGINRNSFYYHYQDMPSMIEEIVLEEINEIIRQHPTVDSLEEGLAVASSFAMENKRAALHLYHSVNRDLLEQHLWRICEYVVETYINTAFADSPIGAADKSFFIRYYKWLCFGAVMDMLRGGIKEDIQAVFNRMCYLKKGMLEEMVNRSIYDEKNRK